MDSRRLSAEQIQQMRAVIMRQSRFLNRLVDRMVKLHWRVDDPVWITTLKAREAVDAMLRELVVRMAVLGIKSIGDWDTIYCQNCP